MKKKIKILFLSFIIIILILLFILSKNIKKDSFDDIIIFKLFSQTNSNNENEKSNKYIFNFTKEKQISLKINLVETIDLERLVNKKIEPGTKGEFELVLNSNKDLYYKMEVKSLNKKPENLFFSIKGEVEQYKTLEELAMNLQGKISKKEYKSIFVEWKWNYQNGSKADIQDTNDGINLKQYNFLINAIGDEI